MIGSSVQIILGDQGDANMSRDDLGQGKSRRKYGPLSADYYEVAERGLRTPANDNGSAMSSKTKNVLKILVPLILGLAFLAWY